MVSAQICQCVGRILLTNLNFLSLRDILFLPLSPVQELLSEQGCFIVLRQAAKQSPTRTTLPFPGNHQHVKNPKRVPREAVLDTTTRGRTNTSRHLTGPFINKVIHTLNCDLRGERHKTR